MGTTDDGFRYVAIHDLKDPDDPLGRTYKEANAARTHAIAIGSLVEIVSDPEWPSSADGVRLYVVSHGRDCDMTPLYYLSADREDTTQEREGWKNRGWVGGYSESSLAVIRAPDAGRGDAGAGEEG
jgi:hypothetical protein